MSCILHLHLCSSVLSLQALSDVLKPSVVYWRCEILILSPPSYIFFQPSTVIFLQLGLIHRAIWIYIVLPVEKLAKEEELKTEPSNLKAFKPAQKMCSGNTCNYVVSLVVTSAICSHPCTS